jgi:hypothetical protein
VHREGVPDDPHVDPFGHTAHVVRVDVVPPLVKYPTGHVRHDSALSVLLYFSTDPHGVHTALFSLL